MKTDDPPSRSGEGYSEVLRRGTSNSNQRGNTRDRAARRKWLVKTFRADVTFEGLPACRCYRCGTLLIESTVTVDRIVPGCRGGTYRRNNIRPACSVCNTATGATTRS
jgi:5-methylcytosine-specific restriction endonuclease McrA